MTRHRRTEPPLPSRRRGFTLVELLAAMTIIGLLLALAVPASMRFFESMQYRQAVRDVTTLLSAARYQAINSGRASDVVIDPRSRQLRLGSELRQLPEGVDITVRSARELNRRDAAVIRFYPEGGSSGGDVDIERPGRDGVRVSVDWLAGRVLQQRYVRQ